MKLFAPVITNGMHLVRARYTTSMMAAFSRREYTTCNIDYPYPDGAMNLAAAAFLKSDCDRMVIIDGDIQFKPSQIDRLLSHDVPLIHGYYCKRVPGVEFALDTLDGKPPTPGEDGLWRLKSAARGFSAWYREVFAMMESTSEEYDCAQTGVTARAYFKTKVGGHSEDYQFCERWRAIGQEVLVDPEVFVKHYGDTGFPTAQECEEFGIRFPEK